MPYFQHLTANENPQMQDLANFLAASEKFFLAVIQGEVYGHSTENLGLFNRQLHNQARGLIEELGRAFEDMRQAINRNFTDDSQALINHGLVGKPQHFKLTALAHIEVSLTSLGIKDWIRKILEQIDNILSSAFEAFRDEQCTRLAAGHNQAALLDIGTGAIINEVKKTIEILLS